LRADTPEVGALRSALDALGNAPLVAAEVTATLGDR
jgi:hypothetical protein